LGTLSWGAGQMCWTWYESIRGDEVPFPSFADIGYLGMPALTVAGLLMLPAAVQSVANRFRSVLDGLMIGCSLLLVSWVMLIGPAISAGADSDLALLISLSYPLGDLVIVTVVVFSVARRRQGGSAPIPLALVGTGIVTFAVADSGFFYLNLIGAYSSGAVIDLGWFVGFTFIMLAARLRGAAPAETGPVEGNSRQFEVDSVELDPVAVGDRRVVLDRALAGVLGPRIGAAFHSQRRRVSFGRGGAVAALHVAVPHRAVDFAPMRGRAAAPPQLEHRGEVVVAVPRDRVGLGRIRHDMRDQRDVIERQRAVAPGGVVEGDPVALAELPRQRSRAVGDDPQCRASEVGLERALAAGPALRRRGQLGGDLGFG